MKCIYIYMHIKLYKLVENYKKNKKEEKKKKNSYLFITFVFTRYRVCIYISYHCMNFFKYIL